MSGFAITRGQGFHVTFENGWTVSVQFGPYNYCANRDIGSATLAATAASLGANGDVECENAEIAAWDASGKWFEFDHDQVDGWKTPADVLTFMQEIAARAD